MENKGDCSKHFAEGETSADNVSDNSTAGKTPHAFASQEGLLDKESILHRLGVHYSHVLEKLAGANCKKLEKAVSKDTFCRLMCIPLKDLTVDEVSSLMFSVDVLLEETVESQ